MPSDTYTERSPQLDARLAGALWLTVLVVSIAAVVGGVSLELTGDSATLAAKALAAAPRIRAGFVMLFLGKICYLGGTVLLYELLKPINRSVALFGAFCGLAGLLSGAHGVNQLTVLSLLDELRRAAEPTAGQLQDAVNIFLAPRPGTEDVYFGFQIVAIGYLIVRSYFLPRAIGVLLVLGGLSFLITAFTSFLSPMSGARLSALLLPVAALSEAALALWLLVKGVNVDRWQSAVSRRGATGVAAP